ncbi:MAG: hypothetical protein QNK37_27900 [Acidobacteriota bacterium]|nr:hypothetical protein [Acidobacteriota bacterium]
MRSYLNAGWQRIRLFTDAANPTSNYIYQKLGYRVIERFAMYRMS